MACKEVGGMAAGWVAGMLLGLKTQKILGIYSYFTYLILGSKIPSNMSEISVPTTVSVANTKRMVEAVNMSCAKKDFNSRGPSVGKLSTTETIILPDIRNGSK